MKKSPEISLRALSFVLPDRSALRELEGTAGLGLTVLLTLDDAAVAGQEAAGLQRAAQSRLEEGQGARDAVTNGTGLARQAAAGDGGDDVELVDAAGHFEGLVDQHAQNR